MLVFPVAQPLSTQLPQRNIRRSYNLFSTRALMSIHVGDRMEPLFRQRQSGDVGEP